MQLSKDIFLLSFLFWTDFKSAHSLLLFIPFPSFPRLRQWIPHATGAERQPLIQVFNLHDIVIATDKQGLCRRPLAVLTEQHFLNKNAEKFNCVLLRKIPCTLTPNMEERRRTDCLFKNSSQGWKSFSKKPYISDDRRKCLFIRLLRLLRRTHDSGKSNGFPSCPPGIRSLE